MKYFNSRLNLTAEPAKLNPENYCVNIDGELRMIPKSLIEGSADWVQQPDWVITAFKHSVGIFKLNKRGNYSNDPDMPGSPLDFFTSVGSEILSVRRSDGVEFKVGDKVELGVIEKFEINKEKMCVILDKHAAAFEIDSPFIQHAPAVLLTTHDGVDITDEKTEIWHVDKVDFTCNKSNAHYFSPIERLAYFSTHKAAENYIAEHKPMYSLADIRKAWDEYSYFDADDFIEQLKQVK